MDNLNWLLIYYRVTDGSEDDENFGDVYDFLMRIVYFNLYAINTYQSYCKKYEGKPGLSPCPQDDYLNITQRVCLLSSIWFFNKIIILYKMHRL